MSRAVTRHLAFLDAEARATHEVSGVTKNRIRFKRCVHSADVANELAEKVIAEGGTATIRPL